MTKFKASGIFISITTTERRIMKKIAALVAVFLSLNVLSAKAEPPKVLAIIDTGVDINHPAIKSNIFYEVCFSTLNSCPNGQNFMEGSGAATVTSEMYTKDSGWNHGTEVASSATQTDPNVKIIEIRCATKLNSNAYLGCNLNLLTSALNWVNSNKNKFNIGAVIAPMGYSKSTCDLTATYVDPVNKLLANNVAVMFPTGNGFDYTRVDNPACLPGVLAISAIDDKGRLALYANYSSRVDFASPGSITVAIPGNKYKFDFGTSLSVATFAAGWLKIANAKNLSYTDEYNLIKNTGTPYTNIMVKKNVLALNIAGALK